MKAGILGAAALLLAACGGANTVWTTPGPGRAEGAPQTRALTEHDVEAIVRGVTSARQLPATRPVAIQRVARERFVKRLFDGHRADDASSNDAEAAYLVAFDFLPAPAARKPFSAMDSVLEEQVVGFYDTKADAIFVMDEPAKSEDARNEQRAVLAHEVEHALQAQHFARMPKPKSSDEALAELALVEGDAQVAMGALLGAEAGAPIGRTLRRIREVTKAVPIATVSRGDEHRQALDHALAVTRQHLEFPYTDGMLFVSDVYRAGGFPLVDRMFDAPPRSTAEVLHPERYLAGVGPRPIADPSPPRGHAVVVVDTLGELDVRLLLTRCLDASRAERIAAGWAGDRYGAFAGPDKKLEVAWVTAWQTDDDAQSFEQALGAARGCFQDNSFGSGDERVAIAGGAEITRQGKLVAVLRGYPEPLRAETARHLFHLVGAEPRAVPRTELKIPPRVPLPEPARGSLRGDVYENAWLGLVGRVPAGMLAATGADGLDFEVHRPDVLVHGGVAISTRVTSDEQNERTFSEVQEALAHAAGKFGRGVTVVSSNPTKTQLGAGIERTFRIDDTAVEMRVVLLPICAGTGSVAFVELYADPYARTVLDGWLDSFRWRNGRNLRACDFLDPK